MGLSFRSPHRYTSILGAGSFTSNFCPAKPEKAEVAGEVVLPACPDIAKRARMH
jgi:hypothetical protein